MENHSWRDDASRIRSAGICVLALYFAVQFVHSDFSVSAVLGALFLCVCAAGSAVLFLRDRAWKTKPWGTADLLLAIYICVVLVNFLRVFSMNRTVLYYLLILGSSALLFWTGAPAGRRELRIAKWILLAAAALVAVLQILYRFFPTRVSGAMFSILSEDSRGYNTYLYSNGYGFALGRNIGYTAAILVTGVGLAAAELTAENWKSRTPLLFLIYWGMLLLQRRGEALASTGLVLLLLVGRFVWVKRTGRPVRPAVIAAGIQIVCLAAAIALIFALPGPNRLEETVQTIHQAEVDQLKPSQDTASKPVASPEQEAKPDGAAEHESSLMKAFDSIGNGRVALWKLAWQGFRTSPVFGHGWGSFAEIAPLSGNQQVTNAHCIYLQLLYETGVVGFLIVCGALAGLFVLLWRRLFSRADRGAFCLCSFSMYCFLLILGEGLIDNSIYYSHYILVLIIGLMIAFRSEETAI